MKCPALHIVDDKVFPTWQWFVPKRGHRLKFKKKIIACQKFHFEILKIEIVSWKWRTEFMQVIVRRELILAFAFSDGAFEEIL